MPWAGCLLAIGLLAPVAAPVVAADTVAPWARTTAPIAASGSSGANSASTGAATAVPPAAPDKRRSGFLFMGPSIQAMQRDDDRNPGMFGVQDGEAVWGQLPRSGAQSCAGCHGAARSAMAGVAARYPAFDDASARPVTLGQRIAACRQRHQGLAPLPWESPEQLALETFVGYQSRGMPIAPPADARLQPFIAQGRQLFTQRMGQLDLSCSMCHDGQAGRRLGGSPIPEGHATGYPLYRLEWQALGSLQRRLRSCMTGVRAEPFPYGAPEWVALELYLAHRARGMPVETPAVRP